MKYFWNIGILFSMNQLSEFEELLFASNKDNLAGPQSYIALLPYPVSGQMFYIFLLFSSLSNHNLLQRYISTSFSLARPLIINIIIFSVKF